MLAKEFGITNEAYIIKVYVHLMLPGKYCHKQFERINTNVIHSDQIHVPLCLAHCIFSFLFISLFHFLIHPLLRSRITHWWNPMHLWDYLCNIERMLPFFAVGHEKCDSHKIPTILFSFVYLYRRKFQIPHKIIISVFICGTQNFGICCCCCCDGCFCAHWHVSNDSF